MSIVSSGKGLLEWISTIDGRLDRIEKLLEKKKPSNLFRKGHEYQNIPDGYVVMARYVQQQGLDPSHLKPLKEFGLIPSMKKLHEDPSKKRGNPYIALQREVDDFLTNFSLRKSTPD